MPLVEISDLYRWRGTGLQYTLHVVGQKLHPQYHIIMWFNLSIYPTTIKYTFE